jgi:hypothetical protein
VSEHDGGEPVGSLGEEAAKLLGTLADWARELDDHIATDDPECKYCPVCRSVHVVRQASPEVRAHLATAASSFLQAAAGMLAAATPSDPDQRAGRTPSVQHIDLDSEPDLDTEP